MVLAGSTGQPMKKSSYAGRIADLREASRRRCHLDQRQGPGLPKTTCSQIPRSRMHHSPGGADNGRMNWKNADGLSINDRQRAPVRPPPLTAARLR